MSRTKSRADSRAESRLGEERIPLSFQRVIPTPDKHGPDFKADRTVPPSEVSLEIQDNVKEYIETLNHEMKMATKLKKAVDDVAAVVENGAAFNKEISGASVVDMQMLLYNTRNMLKGKEKYMNQYKLDSNEQQTTARRLRNAMNEQIHNPRISSASAGGAQRREHSLSPSKTTPNSGMDRTGHSYLGGPSPPPSLSQGLMQDEVVMLRRRVAELEAELVHTRG